VAARIEKLDSMSAHADAVELVRWLSHFKRPPGLTCLVHGEPESMEAFKLRVEERFGWRIRIPDYLEATEV
jgi:metallo-beta-lactamase family protein